VLSGFARVTPWLEKARLARRSDPKWTQPLPPMVASSAKARAELGWSPRCPTNVDVIERLKKVAPCFPDPRIPIWLWTSALAQQRGLATVDLGGFDSRVHLKVDGPRGGDWTIRVEDRKLRVAWGAPRPPTATITLDARFLLDLLAGRADPASAQLTGKLRVQGEGHAALLVGGMISAFRASAQAPGRRGQASRALNRLMEVGGSP
jgi:putative sterol carrier protein